MITIVGYNEDWPKKFGEIHACLIDLLVEEDPGLEVEHIGSTAVEGFVARPILDLCVVVSEESRKKSVIQGLERIGYIHEGHVGVGGAETFRRKGPDVPFLPSKRDFSPHRPFASVKGDAVLDGYLEFRDHLRTDANAKEAFAKLKIDLAPHATAGQYDSAKTEFMETPFPPPRLGVWRMRSSASTAVITIVAYEPYGEGGMEVAVESTDSQGQDSKWGYVTMFDGVFREVTGQRDAETAVEILYDWTTRITNRKDGRVHQVIVSVLSGDRNTLSNGAVHLDEDGDIVRVTHAEYDRVQ